MADNVTFELVSPERRVASLEVSEVVIPGADGDLTAMAGHTPLLTSLRPGIVRTVSAGQAQEYIVSGGFAEISPDKIALLAERAVPREEMDQEMFELFVEDARARYKKVEEASDNEAGPVDDAARLLSDMVAMGDHIGLREPK